MWCVIIILIAVASCNAEELLKVKRVELPSTVNSRIIGGAPTFIEDYPFAVQISYSGRFVCGGSLVTVRHVLSAAHCFVEENGNPLSASQYTLRVGATSLNSGGTVYRVSTIIVHESYNRPILRDNDVAVVLTTSMVALSHRVQTAFIPYSWSVIPDNSTVIAVGWGLTHINNTVPSPVLNEVSVRKINLNVCRSRYQMLQNQTGSPFPITSTMICSGILDVGGRDTCQGDSGGPLIYDRVIVVGITSWGVGCADPVFPGVSARVASYSNWIGSTVARYNAGSLSSKVGAITLLTPILYLILSV